MAAIVPAIMAYGGFAGDKHERQNTFLHDMGYASFQGSGPGGGQGLINLNNGTNGGRPEFISSQYLDQLYQASKHYADPGGREHYEQVLASIPRVDYRGLYFNGLGAGGASARAHPRSMSS